MKHGLFALLLLSAVPVNAHESHRGYASHRTCFRETYREEYVAGTRESKGYVKSFLDRTKVPCNALTKKIHQHYHHYRSIPTYNYSRTHYHKPTTTYKVSRSNSSYSACRSSRATGSVLGGGIAAAISKKDAWSWTIPLGTVIGLSVGDTNC